MKCSAFVTVLVTGSCTVLALMIVYNSADGEQYYMSMRPDNNTETEDVYTKVSFVNIIRGFPWKDYEQSIKNEDLPMFSTYSTKLLLTVFPTLVMPPLAPINNSCKPEKLSFPKSLPKCKRLKQLRKIGILLQFGFEADILEIHLNELEEVVDYFFILESTRSHNHGIIKPLMWDALKGQKRFSTFLPKVVHFVLDDSDNIKEANKIIFQNKFSATIQWGFEAMQERLRWTKFLEWNKITKYFSNSDILGFGDVDEIPNRDVVYYMKHCEIPSDPVDIGIWFPFGRIDTAFSSDWPVKDHSFTLGDPTFWSLGQALNTSANMLIYPTRNRGHSAAYLLGGIHMTNYGYLPVRILEYITASEAKAFVIMSQLSPKMQKLNSYNLRDTELYFSRIPTSVSRRVLSTDNFRKKYPAEFEKIVKLPWFYNCNRNRYPAWENKHDDRLD